MAGEISTINCLFFLSSNKTALLWPFLDISVESTEMRSLKIKVGFKQNCLPSKDPGERCKLVWARREPQEVEGRKGPGSLVLNETKGHGSKQTGHVDEGKD